MSPLKIAVAQAPSIQGDVDANILLHAEFIKIARAHDVAYLVFPELSLTGYEPELASALAFTVDDARLQPLIALAVANNMHIVVGAPIATDSKPSIGAFTISPRGSIETYAKMHLHPGEDRYFTAGRAHHVITVGGTKIANAICADTNHRSHAEWCAESGATIYIAGVLITARGYAADTRQLQAHARNLNMLVAMANHSQPTGGWKPIGKSAIWAPSGLIASANETSNALLIAEKNPTGWTGSAIEI
ncbi:carbon-nitrogen hydrolase family protein [Pseudomonas sp.]|uniref:carbon-nitrogen hydrolase family protein n=1 Tax=Pseudomonas sp. TaxID=306 RepID=UPI0027348374|nr:carbon-nitrogen hydrolase family protein [Pseudomonas sp.]MDP3815719.1 carbon-nitrogen hydrolase family protein [Pseudomonas sp.]